MKIMEREIVSRSVTVLQFSISHIYIFLCHIYGIRRAESRRQDDSSLCLFSFCVMPKNTVLTVELY